MADTVSLEGFGNSAISLNFKVIGCASEPDDPKENMIWANTPEKVTGWEFSPTEPEEFYEGMVWILTGNTSTVSFNALKKNGIRIYPLIARQYVAGAWVDVDAKIYQNGEWVSWITYLYNNGNECTALTGGWTSTPSKNVGGYFVSDSITVTKNTNHTKITSDKTACGKLVHTKNKINLKDVKDLIFNCVSTVSGDCSVKVGAWSAIPTTSSYVDPVASITNPNGIVSLDVSSLSGEYYIGVFASSYSTGTLAATLTDVHY